MSENNYSPLLPKWKVKLINRRALRMGFRRDELDDVQQQIVPHVIRFVFDPAKANGAREQTVLVALIDQQLKAMARAQSRYRRHVEQLRQDLSADGSNDEMPRAAICHEPQELVLDVQLAVAALPPRERAICTALGEGRSMSQIAQDLGCTWHAVRRVVGDIRTRFQAMGLEGWMGR